jgi:hypothetical protein
MRRVSGWRGGWRGAAGRLPACVLAAASMQRERPAQTIKLAPTRPPRCREQAQPGAPDPSRRPSSSRAHCARQQAASTRHWKITARAAAAMGGRRQGGGGWRRASPAILYRCASARAQSPPSDPHHPTRHTRGRCQGALPRAPTFPPPRVLSRPRAGRAGGEAALSQQHRARHHPQRQHQRRATCVAAPAEPPSFEGLPQAALAAVVDLLRRADLPAAACACRAWRREAADDRCAGLSGRAPLAGCWGRGCCWPAVGAAGAALVQPQYSRCNSVGCDCLSVRGAGAGGWAGWWG